MRRRAILAASVAALVATLLAACGIDAIGSFVEEPLPDRGIDDDGSAPAMPTDGEASDGGTADAGIDVEAGPRCDASLVVDDPLSAIDASTWILIADTSNVGWPQVETTAEGPAVALVTPSSGGNLGAIYLAQPLAIRAFDVKVRSLVTCPDAGGCSDGLAIVWLATDGGAPALQTYTSTPTFGIPAAVAGAGVAFDLQTDLGPNDPASPSVSLLAIDGVGAPGGYDWHTKSAPAPTFVGNRDLTLSLRKGQLTARVGGATAIAGPVDAGFTGYFGFAASTGGAIGHFVLRNFSATFYECDDP